MPTPENKEKAERGVLGCETSKPIVCMGCNFISCGKCTQTFILSQTSAKCMSCNREYSEDYLREHFSKSWMSKEYANWKKAKLLEREKSLLPETVEHLNNEKLLKEILLLISNLKVEKCKSKFELDKQRSVIKQAELQLKTLKRDKSKKDSDELKAAISNIQIQLNLYKSLSKRYAQLDSQIYVFNRSTNGPNHNRYYYKNNTIEALFKKANKQIRKIERKNGKIEYQAAYYGVFDEDGNQLLDTNGQPIYDEVEDVKEDKEERKAFIKPCPAPDCRGFLSSKWICGLCDTVVCKDCHEIKGKKKSISSSTEVKDEDNENKEDDEFKDHKCDPNNIETAKALQKETKGCPKCGIRIFKIDGCFAPDTQILMWDKTVKLAKDIVVGDQLIGDDGFKRTVVRLMNGEDNMYSITQNHGCKYIVNSHHTLVLKYIDFASRAESTVELTVKQYLK